jgi:hypothetical protein
MLTQKLIYHRVHECENMRASGLAIKFYCSQDKHRKQKVHKSEDLEKHRDTMGMDRFPCMSWLQIDITHHTSTGAHEVTVRFHHEVQHKAYTSVDLPAAAYDLIRQQIVIAKPSDLLSVVHELDGCQHVSGAQVHRAWRELSEVLWRRDSDAVTSAVKLLEEYAKDGRACRLDITLPDGVTAVAWALPKIADRVAKMVKELAIDATCEPSKLGSIEVCTLIYL